MTRARVALFLYLSGACSLVYETVWFRELRLVFGSSTTATAAVVACFIGGLGAGGLFLGKRADRAARPLALYGTLEAIAGASAALSPVLLYVVRHAYVAMGGSTSLGWGLGTVVRLLLSALVFAVPTIAMGATLPAAARSLDLEGDEGRRGIALLYGANTLGAVTGTLLSTFVLLEALGSRITLLAACLVNLLVAVVARRAGRRVAVVAPPAPSPAPARSDPALLAAAAVVGFAFCLMELVWYRMLAPLLGGTLYTFGVILAVALSGIAAGGIGYGLFGSRRSAPSLGAFATTTALEGLALAVPYALGDRIALAAGMTWPLGLFGLGGAALGWTVIAVIVVFPAAVLSGVQFAMLVARASQREGEVGVQVGRIYAANTLGSMAGSLAGGFGLLPLLSAQGAWRLGTYLLVGCAAAVLARDLRRARRAALGAAVIAALTLFLLRGAEGPTAAWRHSGVGVGRGQLGALHDANGVLAWEHAMRGRVAWEIDGRESSVAVIDDPEHAFFVNGKSDGAALSDRGTQVMAGLLPALLHPAPRRAMVVGLGTGSSAGWLAAVPTMERVDVAELEPAILRVARECAPVNAGVMDNPKAVVTIGDARELLLTSSARYDVVFSEPSNPYRAGIAALFTKEFYASVAARLAEGGIFAQWLQGYEVDAQTVRTIMATLASVFGEVTTWQTQPNDLLFVATLKPMPPLRLATLASRMAEEPYRSALAGAWRVTDTRGFLAHFVAGAETTARIARAEGDALATDDLNLVEFGFARAISGAGAFGIAELRGLARGARDTLPPIDGPTPSEEAMRDAYASFMASEDAGRKDLARLEAVTRDQDQRYEAFSAYADSDLPGARAAWAKQARAPESPTELAVMAMAYAATRADEAPATIAKLRAFDPVEADVAAARAALARDDRGGALVSLVAALEGMHHDPWVWTSYVRQALGMAKALAQGNPGAARILFHALEKPFVVSSRNGERKEALVAIARALPAAEGCVRAFAGYEPHPVWTEASLVERSKCYATAGSPLAGRAAEDVAAFARSASPRLAPGFAPSEF